MSADIVIFLLVMSYFIIFLFFVFMFYDPYLVIFNEALALLIICVRGFGELW